MPSSRLTPAFALPATVWTFGDEQQMGIARWDAITRKTTLLASGRDPVSLFADQRNIYWQEPSGGRSSGRIAFMSMPIVGGSPRSVFEMSNGSWDAQETLLRTPKRGGPTETLWSGPIRWIQIVAVDACNVYWVASNRAELFYRAK